jgi:hypothetical protein
MTHGLASTYTKGCRCPRCREAHRRRHKRLRDERAARARADASVVPHGTVGGYSNWDCRCDRCRHIWSLNLARQSYHRKVAAGREPSPFEERAAREFRAEVLRQRRQNALAKIAGAMAELEQADREIEALGWNSL